MAVWTNLVNALRFLKGDAVPNQYYNPDTNQMEIVQGANGASNVSLSGSNPATVCNVAGPITVAAGATYGSPVYSIPVNSSTSLAYTWASCNTTATANWSLICRTVDSVNNGYGLTSQQISKTTGTGEQHTLTSNGCPLMGGASAQFLVVNNDNTNSITLNSGKVYLH